MRVIKHFNEPQVELIGCYGGDERHAGSAWISTGTELEQNLHRVQSLLEMLILDEHHTPFEKSTLHFIVTVDQATHIHLLKSRIGVSINGESARYKELTEDRILHPQGITSSEIIYQNAEIGFQYYHKCLETEKSAGTPRKRAKESCRYLLPMNSMIKLDISFNFRSWMHFDGLRNSPHAQYEVRVLAQKMRKLIEEIPGEPFKYSLEAYDLYKGYKTEFMEYIKEKEKIRKANILSKA